MSLDLVENAALAQIGDIARLGTPAFESFSRLHAADKRQRDQKDGEGRRSQEYSLHPLLRLHASTSDIDRRRT